MANGIVISDHRASRTLTYTQVRVLLLGAGLLFLGITAGVNYVRRVETAEVMAILFFIPIFIAFVFWDWIGGAIAALGAIAGYVALRADAIHTVGFGQFRGVILSRSLAFLAFGIVGGLANRRVRAQLSKLDLYDQVDDITGLFNARYFIEATDLEISRAGRYQTQFSVAIVDIPVEAYAGTSRRRRIRALRDIGEGIRKSVRTVDRVVHASDGERYRFAVLLPETPASGATIFVDRLVDRLTALLGVDSVTGTAVAYPDDAVTLKRLRREFADIDRAQHPEHPTPLGVVAA
jgi:GGDEF domain-containing protein